MEWLFLLLGLDPVILIVCIILVVLSCVSWTIWMCKSNTLFWANRKIKRWQLLFQPGTQQVLLQDFGQNVDLNHKLTKLTAQLGAVGVIATTGMAQKQAWDLSAQSQTIRHSLSLSQYLESQLKLAVNQVSNRAKWGLGTLASIASVSPFIGLFGTVWGIYLALQSMSADGINVSIHTLSGPMGEALLVTALGLLVAVPSLVFYNGLCRKVEQQRTELNTFAQHWHNYLLTGVAPNFYTGK